MLFFKNKKLVIITAISIVACIAIGMFAYGKLKNNDDLNSGVEEGVETYTIPEGEKIFINGVIVPKESKDFYPPEGDEISSISVKNGQSVKKGDLLFTSKNNSAASELSSLNSQLSDIKNQRNLSSSVEEKTSLDIEIKKLNSQISTVSKKVSNSTYAPFSGTVFLNEDNQNSEQPSAFISLQGEEFYMKGKASEQDLAKMNIDQTVDVMIFSNSKKLTGRISYISKRPSSDAASSDQQSSLSYYDINIAFDSQEDLVNGFHVQASFKVSDSSFKIPSSCILKDGKKSYVFKDLDGTLKKQTVDVASKNDEFAIIRSGLKENDNIIKFPTEDMKEGDPVGYSE